VAHGPKPHIFDSLSVDGPMGRDVRDTALLLDAQAGVHPRDPISLEYPARSFQDSIAEARPVKRVGFSADLGVTPVAREIREICAAAATRFTDTGAKVEEATPDLKDAHFVFQTLRAFKFATDRSKLLAEHRDKLKPDVIWNIEQGLALTAERIAKALLHRSRLYGEMVKFLGEHEFLLAPSACCPPNPIGERWVRQVDGHVFENYLGWLTLPAVITLTSCPALAIPAGFTGDGRPVGIQLVGAPRGDAELLSAGAAIEEILGVSEAVPIDPKPARAL
jgi:amidase